METAKGWHPGLAKPTARATSRGTLAGKVRANFIQVYGPGLLCHHMAHKLAPKLYALENRARLKVRRLINLK